MKSTAEAAAREFIETEHNAPRIQMLSYQLGEYYFRQQQFEDALACTKKQALIT